jgi:hypothetical protein
MGQVKTENGKNKILSLKPEGSIQKVCVSIWGDKINEQQLIDANTLIIDFEIESREFSGCWYTDLKGWKVELVRASNQTKNKLDNIDPLGLNEKPDVILPY